MKNLFLISLLIGFLSKDVFAQTILNDPAIVAQHKRMVYHSWGDFKPSAKRVLGVPTNINYITIWGSLAPSRNRKYRKGSDIRPLNATGLETQRLLLLQQQKKFTEETAMEVDALYKRDLQDFSHWTSETIDADILWVIYYQKMLRPLKEIPLNPEKYTDWGFKSETQLSRLKETGAIDRLIETLELAKNKLWQSRNTAMPRGKRLLLYHDVLIDWRNFLNQLHTADRTSFLSITKTTEFHMETSKPIDIKSDSEIIQEIMNHYKNRF